MLDNKHLKWVVANRRSALRTQRVVEAAEIAMDRIIRHRACNPPLIDELISGIVDSEFHCDCTIGTIAKGILTVYVNDARLICHYRTRWSFELLEALRASGVRSVRFSAGDARYQGTATDEYFAETGKRV